MKITNNVAATSDPASGVITITTEEIRAAVYPYDEAIRSYYTDVLNTKEALVREHLIRLGWTPPPDAPVTMHSNRITPA